jgi:flavin reductase
MPREVTPGEFRRTLASFATGVTVVTTTVGGILHGMTANAFSSVSLDPLLVLVCVDRTAGMHELLPRAQAFAVTVLAADQIRLSVWFASRRRPSGRDQFDGIEWHPAPVTGCPVLSEGLAFVDCHLTAIHDGGDHSIFLGKVVDLGSLKQDAEPLIWYEGGYHRLTEGLQRAEQTIAEVSEARKDETTVIETVIDGSGDDADVGMEAGHAGDAFGGGDDADEPDVSRTTLLQPFRRECR